MVPLTRDMSNLFGTACWGVLMAFVPFLAIRGFRLVLRLVKSDWKLPE